MCANCAVAFDYSKANRGGRQGGISCAGLGIRVLSSYHAGMVMRACSCKRQHLGSICTHNHITSPPPKHIKLYPLPKGMKARQQRSGTNGTNGSIRVNIEIILRSMLRKDFCYCMRTQLCASCSSVLLHASTSEQQTDLNLRFSSVACICTAAAAVLNEQHPQRHTQVATHGIQNDPQHSSKTSTLNICMENHHDNVLPTAKHLARSKARLCCSEVENSESRWRKIGLQCHHMQYCSTALGMHARQQARCRQPAQCFVPRLWVPLSRRCACNCTSETALHTLFGMLLAASNMMTLSLRNRRIITQGNSTLHTSASITGSLQDMVAGC